MAIKNNQTGRRGTMRTSVSLKLNDYEHIAQIAAQKKVSIAWVIREAVEKYLDARSPLFRTETH